MPHGWRFRLGTPPLVGIVAGRFRPILRLMSAMKPTSWAVRVVPKPAAQCGANAVLDMIRKLVTLVISDSTSEKEQVGSTIRNLVAAQLQVNLKRVTDEARLVEDLGADWLDRLELIIAIEDQFGCVEIEEDQADKIIRVGDIIRFVETHHH